MHPRLTRNALSLAALTTLAFQASPQPVSANGIGVLAQTYLGVSHHIVEETAEDIDFQISVSSVNGSKFQGLFSNVVPISGKVAANGKLTFAGKLAGQGFTVRVDEGIGQLSATGRFITGSYRLRASVAGLVVPGKYTYQLERSEN